MCVRLTGGHIPEEWTEMKGGLGMGRKPLQGKRAEPRGGGQRSTVWELSRGRERGRLLIRERKLSDHGQDITQNRKRRGSTQGRTSLHQSTAASQDPSGFSVSGPPLGTSRLLPDMRSGPCIRIVALAVLRGNVVRRSPTNWKQFQLCYLEADTVPHLSCSLSFCTCKLGRITPTKVLLWVTGLTGLANCGEDYTWAGTRYCSYGKQCSVIVGSVESGSRPSGFVSLFHYLLCVWLIVSVCHLPNLSKGPNNSIVCISQS